MVEGRERKWNEKVEGGKKMEGPSQMKRVHMIPLILPQNFNFLKILPRVGDQGKKQETKNGFCLEETKE